MSSSQLGNSKKASHEILLISSLAAFSSTMVTQPLEVLKTRSQAQPLLYSRHTTSLIGMTRQLLQEGSRFPSSSFGARIFWAGTIPALCRCVPGVSLYFLLINALSNQFPRCGQASFDAFLLGFTTRSIIGAALSPFSVVKMHSEAGLAAGRSTIQSLLYVYRTNNVYGFFHGLPATLARDSPYSGFYLLFYLQLKNTLQPIAATEHLVEISSLSALLSAILASLVTQPADVLRASRQLTGRHRKTPVASTNLFHVFSEIIRIDGVFGLWRGLSLRLIRRAVFACITWTLFDSIPVQTC